MRIFDTHHAVPDKYRGELFWIVETKTLKEDAPGFSKPQEFCFHEIYLLSKNKIKKISSTNIEDYSKHYDLSKL